MDKLTGKRMSLLPNEHKDAYVDITIRAIADEVKAFSRSDTLKFFRDPRAIIDKDTLLGILDKVHDFETRTHVLNMAEASEHTHFNYKALIRFITRGLYYFIENRVVPELALPWDVFGCLNRFKEEIDITIGTADTKYDIPMNKETFLGAISVLELYVNPRKVSVSYKLVDFEFIEFMKPPHYAYRTSSDTDIKTLTFVKYILIIDEYIYFMDSADFLDGFFSILKIFNTELSPKKYRIIDTKTNTELSYIV